jgi:hypothetical protein
MKGRKTFLDQSGGALRKNGKKSGVVIRKTKKASIKSFFFCFILFSQLAFSYFDHGDVVQICASLSPVWDNHLERFACDEWKISRYRVIGISGVR